MENMNVLVIEPGKKPYAKEIPSGLESLQYEVGGDIQAVYPYEEPVALVCDEEGKIKGKDLNRALRDEEGEVYDIVAGTFLVVGLGAEDFTSLTPEQTETFMKKFDTPELFMRVNGKIAIFPLFEPGNPQYDKIPLYTNTADYAREHGEMGVFRASDNVNIACKEAIEQAIADNYHDSRLSNAGAKNVIERFGMTRTMMVLANTILHKEWDGRFSDSNKEWAKTIPIPEVAPGDDRNRYFTVNRAHPGLVDLFTSQVRRENKERTDNRTSVLSKLKEAATEPMHHAEGERQKGDER